MVLEDHLRVQNEERKRMVDALQDLRNENQTVQQLFLMQNVAAQQQKQQQQEQLKRKDNDIIAMLRDMKEENNRLRNLALMKEQNSFQSGFQMPEETQTPKHVDKMNLIV